MESAKSLDELNLIAALLLDVQTLHSEVLSPRAARLTYRKICKRVAREGIGFLTKTLPRLGKAFDRALSGECLFDSTKLGLKSKPCSSLPLFMGELFECIFSHDGRVLPDPCVKCITTIRQLCYLYYKYELPYDHEDEDKVIQTFKECEDDLRSVEPRLLSLQRGFNLDSGRLQPVPRAYRQTCRDGRDDLSCTQHCALRIHRITGDGERNADSSLEIDPFSRGRDQLATEASRSKTPVPREVGSSSQRLSCLSDKYLGCDEASVENVSLKWYRLTYRARKLLHEVFVHFDPLDIYPSHGPGAVSTKERLWRKYRWTRISKRITEVYPLDAYFFASLGHFCDSYRDLGHIKDHDAFAQVCLVPKDSRGPRLISCEPIDHQWIQQGLGRAVVSHVERHPLTKDNVHFTDQTPNQLAALLGSMKELWVVENGIRKRIPTPKSKRYATLDLKEASDRVHLDLVRLLFPPHVFRALECCRSHGTMLPGGELQLLRKFAPMGSALCFPIMALTIWSLLTAAASDADTRESILVYGDDVVVPTEFVRTATNVLEFFGFKINRDKSYSVGFFRESCGVDAFNGTDVTPVRFRTVWAHHPAADSYVSWIAYANSLWHRKYYNTYDYIVEALHRVYGELPSLDMNLSCPSLVSVPEVQKPKRFKLSQRYQKVVWRVWDVKSPKINWEIDGWSMLLRYFAENIGRPPPNFLEHVPRRRGVDESLRNFIDSEFPLTRFSVSSYTKRRTSMLVRCWR